MNKYKFLMILILLLFSISSVYATNTTSESDNSDIITSETAESGKIISKTVETSNYKEDVIADVDNYASLIEKIDDKEANETINLKNTTYEVTTPVTMKYRNIAKNVVINGNGATIDGQGSQAFLTIAPNHNVTINDLIIKNTVGTAQAGAIVVSSNASLILNNCLFINDISSGKGGALTNRGNTVINDCEFNSNTAYHGGVIWSTGEHGGSLLIQNSRFINNKASHIDDYERTAIVYLVTGGNVNIINNTFENSDGGTIHNYGTNLTIKQNIFKNIHMDVSKVTIRGGVIDNYEAPVCIEDNVFENIELYVETIRGGILYNEIGTSSFNNNTVSQMNIVATGQGDSLNGGILFNRNSTLTVMDNVFNNQNNGYRIHGGSLYNNIGVLNATNNTFNTENIASWEIRGGAIYNDKDGDLISTLYYSDNSFDNITNNGPVNNEIIYNIGISKDMEDYPIKATKITVNSIQAAVSDQVTFTAYVQDLNGNPVTGGNLVFKINGKTLRTDGTLDGSVSAYKVNVVDGKANITINVTKSMRGAKTISASYSGSKKYYANTTETDAPITILLRNASLKVKVTPSTQKQYDSIQFTANITDITHESSSVISNNENSYVFFKINGVTLKDANGEVIKVKVINGIATYDYIVPAGMSAIGKDKKIRYYNVTAGFVNPDYYPDTKDFTTFKVLKSNITIETSQVSLDLKQHTLLLTGSIKDFKNNNVIGVNKLSIKLNGKTMKINDRTTTDITDGVISVYFTIPSSIQNVKQIELVTGARTAYEGYRLTLTSF